MSNHVQSFILGHKSRVLSELRSMPTTGSLKQFSKSKAQETQHTFIPTFKKHRLRGEKTEEAILERRASEPSEHREIMTSRERLFCSMGRSCARHLHSARLKPYISQTFLGRILIFYRR